MESHYLHRLHLFYSSNHNFKYPTYPIPLKISIKNTLLNFIFYLRNPKVPQSKQSVITVKSFYILFIFSMCINFILDLTSSNESLIKILKLKDSHFFEDDLLKKGILLAILLVGIITPFIEEFLQRYNLTSFLWNYRIMPFNLGIIIIQLFHIRTSTELLSIFAIGLFVAFFLNTCILKSPKYKIYFLRFYIRNYWLFFYSSAVAFGVLHIENHQIENFIPMLPILLVLPQIFTGLLLGYIRISMGLRWSILFHGLHNSFLVALLFIVP